jgi:hypothetical protein
MSAVASSVRSSAARLVTSAFLTIVVLVGLLGSGHQARVATAAVLGLAVAAYVGVVHPLSVFVGLAAVIAFAPFVHVPGTPVPILLVLSVGVWLSLPSIPGVKFRPGAPELWLALLAGTALLSLVATGISPTSLTEYVAWLAATSIVVPIRLLPDQARRSVMRGFVAGAGAAAALGILLVRIDPDGQLLGRLSFAGYTDARGAQYVPLAHGPVTRLTGTYVEPNIAGLVLAVGVVLAVVALRGTLRVVVAAVIGLALVLTLSRSALATVVVAGVLVVMRVGGRQRIGLLGAGAAAAVALVSIPAARDRLLESFGPSDTGTMARVQALQDFPQLIEGHWLWGLGWAREEFRDPVVGRLVNYVANTPLITVYRGGIVLGLLVVLILVILVLRSWLAARGAFEEAVLCCTVIAFVLVALQLDFPVALQYPATALFSLLVGLSWRARDHA